MPFDGNGNWVADFSAKSDRDANIKIMASRFDDIHQADLKESFENCLTKDGQVKPLQNFNANNFRVINVANPVQDNDAVNKQTLDNMLGTLYPIGALYIGTQTTCPLATLISGSTWELVAKDKALWTGDGTNADTTISAGLPNITGTFQKGQVGIGNPTEATGCISSVVAVGAYNLDGGNASNKAYKVSIDASGSSSIYGNSSTVQPPAYVVNVWRRTA